MRRDGMAWDGMAKRQATPNPILRAELARHRHNDRQPARWRRYLTRGLYVLALLVSAIVYFGEWTGVLLWRETRDILTTLLVTLPFLLVYVVVMHLILSLRTLALATHSVSRETATGTWDVLILTHQSGWRIVVGKWWATLVALRRPWLRLVPLRVGLVTFIAAYLSHDTMVYLSFLEPGQIVAPPSAARLLLIIPLLLAYTVLNAAVLAAIGVLAGLFVRRANTALALAVSTAVGLLVCAVIGGLVVQRVISESYELGDYEGYADYVVAVNLVNTLIVTAVDNGTTLNASLVTYRLLPPSVRPADAAWALFDLRNGRYDPDRTRTVFGSLALSFASGVGLLAALLWLARRAARRAGALLDS